MSLRGNDHSEASKKFFSNGGTNDGTVAQGASYLVARSQLGDASAGGASVMEEDEALLMELAELVTTLTPKQQACDPSAASTMWPYNSDQYYRP
jgi:hypothetical protein